MSEETHCAVWKIAFFLDGRQFHAANTLKSKAARVMRKRTTVNSSLHAHALTHVEFATNMGRRCVVIV